MYTAMCGAIYSHPSQSVIACLPVPPERPLSTGWEITVERMDSEALRDLSVREKTSFFNVSLYTATHPNIVRLRVYLEFCMEVQRRGQNPNTGSLRDRLIGLLKKDLTYGFSHGIMQNLTYDPPPLRRYKYEDAPNLFDQLKRLFELNGATSKK
jgi:hypothetical protein